MFFCSAPKSLLRKHIAEACVHSWGRFPEIHIERVKFYESQFVAGSPYQRQRRIDADSMACTRFRESEFYILTDDDMLLLGHNSVRDGMKILARHPEFGILSALPRNESISKWRPPDRVAFEDGEVFEHHSVGGIRFCRKGVVGQWPKMGDSPGYDGLHCSVIREAGYRVGYFTNVLAIHCGKDLSETWNP